MAADPGQLGRGEAGHDEVAATFAEGGRRGVEASAFGEGAAVVPQDRGAERPVVGAEQSRAVHLAGQADAAHRSPHRWIDGEDRGTGRLPPGDGVLLRPQGLRALDGERGGALCDERAGRVQDDRLDARRADIDAEEHALSP